MKFTNLFCASLLTFFASSALADPAAVITDFSCMGFVPDSEPTIYLFTNEAHKVVTKKGTRILSCHFDHELDLPHAVGEKGFPCYVNLTDGTDPVLTDDSMMLTAPGGRAMLTCKVSK